MRKDLAQTTPSLPETVRYLIDAKLVDLHTCMPAKVVFYNPATQTADVLPSIMTRYEGEPVARPLPIIPNVPVVHAKTLLAHIHMPLSPGDDVVLVFSERSLDRWKSTGNIADPNDRRRHNLTDAFALVGGSGIPGSFSVTDPTAVEIVNGAASASVGLAKIESKIGTTKTTLTATAASMECGAAKVSMDPTGGIKLGSTTPFSVALAEKVLVRLAAIEAKINSHIVLYDAHSHPTAPPGPVSVPTTPDTPLVPSPDPIGSIQTAVQA